MRTQTNRGRLLALIRERGAVHQTELAAVLNVEKSTICRIVKKLIEKNVLIKGGELPAGKTGGRKSVLLTLNPKGACALAVDLDVETTRVGLVSLTGRVMASRRIETPSTGTPDSIIMFLSDSLRRFLKVQSIDGRSLVGVGIATPGIVNASSGTVISTFCFEGWDHVPLAAALSRRIGLPVHVDNNARLEAIAERCFGACRKRDDFLCVSIRNGIGLGVFTDGKILRGAHHQAGDMHWSLDANGPRCRCGREGCVEAMAGTRVIIDSLRDPNVTTLKELVVAMSNPDSNLKRELDLSGRHIGRLIAHLTELFDPEKVILGGPLIHAGDHLFRSVQAAFQTHAHKDRWVVEALTKSELKNDAALVGAAVMAMDPLFECGF